KAIESANDQMDQKLFGIVDRQADNKRKFDNTSRNQQNQQPFKRNNNVAQAYAAGNQAANPNYNNNNRRATVAYQGVPTCFECGAQGHYKRNCPRVGNRNQGNQNQDGNENVVARAYRLGTAGGNANVNVVTVMSSDSHATITYTSMSSYEVIVNGYYGMPMDPLDPYVQLVIEVPPSPDYISRPEAPPSPDYIPGPEAPPSPDYIPGPEYPEYLPPADDVLPAEEQPLPAAVSPTTESPGYITESEPEMEPEEEDGDDEKSEEDSIEYLTSRGDDDADNDGDDLSEDDADDEEEEESSDSVEEEEEHIASTVPTLALYSSVYASEETEPFEEGKTAATPPPFGYLSPSSYPLPPFLMPLPIFTPLPTSSFPLPLSLPSTSGSESIPEEDISLWKRARFTTPTGGYEVGESSVVAAARQIRPALTIADRCRLRREAIFSHLSREVHTSTLVTQMEALQRDVSTLQRQYIDDEDRLTRHIQHEHAQRDVAPEDGDSCL
nr:hypothetical protein [Tanacetum cinerariifolium]